MTSPRPPLRTTAPSCASCRSRPTIGESRCRGADGSTSRTPRSLHAGTGSPLPFTSSGATSSASTSCRTSRYVASPSRISPGAACCSRRAATLTGIPGDQRLSRGRIARHDPSGVHADVDADRDTAIAFELLVQVRESVTHVDDGATRPERVIFVQLRDPEHGHHRVADVLLDRPSVAFDRRAHRVEVAGLDVAERLGIELLSQLRGAGDVTEDDGDGLANLGRRRCRHERR